MAVRPLDQFKQLIVHFNFDGEDADMKTPSLYCLRSFIIGSKSHKQRNSQLPLHHFEASDWFTWQFTTNSAVIICCCIGA